MITATLTDRLARRADAALARQDYSAHERWARRWHRSHRTMLARTGDTRQTCPCEVCVDARDFT